MRINKSLESSLTARPFRKITQRRSLPRVDDLNPWALDQVYSFKYSFLSTERVSEPTQKQVLAPRTYVTTTPVDATWLADFCCSTQNALLGRAWIVFLLRWPAHNLRTLEVSQWRRWSGVGVVVPAWFLCLANKVCCVFSKSVLLSRSGGQQEPVLFCKPLGPP